MRSISARSHVNLKEWERFAESRRNIAGQYYVSSPRHIGSIPPREEIRVDEKLPGWPGKFGL